MLQSGRKGFVDLECARYETVAKFMQFLCSSRVKFEDDASAFEQLKIALRYDVRALQACCASYLIKNLNTNNAIEAFTIGFDYEIENLAAYALRYLVLNERKVMVKREFEKIACDEHLSQAYVEAKRKAWIRQARDGQADTEGFH